MTLWTVAHRAPLSMGFSRQEYWSGLPCPSPGDLADPGSKLAFLTSNLHSQAGSLPLAPPGKPRTSVVEAFFLPRKMMQAYYSQASLHRFLTSNFQDFKKRFS